MNTRLSVSVGLICLPLSVLAEGTVVSARLGSLGLSVEGGFGLTEQFSTRLGINRYQYDTTERVDGNKYDLDLDWQSISLFADWHPFDVPLRFTAGFLRNSNEIQGETSASSITIGDTLYRDVGLKADVDFRTFAPYLGLGWESGLFRERGWGFNVDLGVMYQGTGRVNLTATGMGADLVDPNDLAREEERFEEDLEDYRYYPVFSFGVSYKF
ncbi:MAG: hypothetical protein ABW095_16840 [Candidatus Thiodiazotropha sp.]